MCHLWEPVYLKPVSSTAPGTRSRAPAPWLSASPKAMHYNPQARDVRLPRAILEEVHTPTGQLERQPCTAAIDARAAHAPRLPNVVVAQHHSLGCHRSP